LFERIGSDKFWESKGVMLGLISPMHQISELRENFLPSQKIMASYCIYHWGGFVKDKTETRYQRAVGANKRNSRGTR
jgi:hypothetical protein